MYFDYAATTPVEPSVLESFLEAQKIFYGNPDSLHEQGRRAANLIADAKGQIATLLNVDAQSLIFTSGATEANNLAILGTMYQKNGNIVTTNSEHASVAEPIGELSKRGIETRVVKVNRFGVLNLEAILDKVDQQTVLLSIIHVNNELGSVNDVATLAKKLKAKFPSLLIHVDMAQSIGKARIDLSHIDYATFSGHKFYAPKGIGMLYAKNPLRLHPLLFGGQQQNHLRPGTLNAALIASFAKAMRIALENFNQNYQHVEQLNQQLRSVIDEMDVFDITLGESTQVVPHILHLYLNEQSIQIETLIHALSAEQMYVSTRSTCHSKSLSESNPLLEGLGYSASESRYGLRISLSYLTSAADIEELGSVLKKVVETYLSKRS